jgi:two-component system OmpR family sensor kinase
MRRPLFLKIFLGVCLSFVFVTIIVWLTDSILQQNPSRTAERIAGVGLAGAASAIRLGGERALRDELATWPAAERAYLAYGRIDTPAAPKADLLHSQFVTTATDPDGHRYAISYQVHRFDGFIPPPLVFDMGPRVAFGTLLGISIFSLALTFYLITPIGRIRAAFRQVAAGDLKVRLGPAWLRRRDEIADMAADFDKMAARLEELVTSRDRLLADISHELRSPLARLHLAIDLARQSPEKTSQSLQRIRREADKLEDMVGELLALSKLEHGIAASNEYFFISEITGIVVEDARYEAQEKGVAIEFVASTRHWGQEALVVGSGKLISRAIENVVRNALRFSRRGETITIEMQTDAAGTTLYIRDEGPGVKEGQLDTLFEPFVQANPADNQGYGLGLAIARRAVTAHGGTIKATNGMSGGLTVTLWLPAAPDAPEAAEESRSVWDKSISPLPI